MRHAENLSLFYAYANFYWQTGHANGKEGITQKASVTNAHVLALPIVAIHCDLFAYYVHYLLYGLWFASTVYSVYNIYWQ